MLNSSYQIAEIKLSYKNRPDISSRPTIIQSKDAYAVLLGVWDDDQIGFIEQAKVLLLNRANIVLGVYNVGSGGVSGVTVDPKLVFIAALKANASSIILAHNHPSENLSPSHADKALTKKLTQAGEFLDITVYDHLIVAPTGYYSFSDDATYSRDASELKDQIAQFQGHNFSKPKGISMSSNSQLQIFDNSNSVFQETIVVRASDAYSCLFKTWEQNSKGMRPGYRILFMNKEHRLAALQDLYLNKADTCYHDAGKVITMAAKANAQHFILAQSKPYGILLPNQKNLQFADVLKQAGDDNDLIMQDYILINDQGYYSYAENEFHLGSSPQP